MLTKWVWLLSKLQKKVFGEKNKKTKKTTTIFNPETETDPDRKPIFQQKTNPDPDRLTKVNPADDVFWAPLL
jgi:hypothetical protein